ncbi:MAG: LLM class flavin-dependent oxidoreductase [Thaumarchaeota archaeon]|nr:LLM class flavin-dependent oxidoreductase [Nitrososphaerota archaeon]
MKFGLNLHINSPSQIRAISKIARAAEDYGFSQLWWADTNFNWADPYVGLTICALNTSSIKLGTSVTNPLSRHPAVTANASATIDVLSGGRFTLGIAVGDNSVRTIGRKPSTISRLVDTVNYIKHVHEGRNSKVQNYPSWSGHRDIPVYVAGTGPKVLDAAGRVADGFITLGASQEILRTAIDEVRNGARLAGRDFSKMERCLSASCSIASTHEEAYDNVRSVVGSMLHSSPEIAFRLASLPQTAREELDALCKSYNYREHGETAAGHSKAVKDWMVDLISIAGTVDECEEKIRMMESIGIDQIIIPIIDVQVEKFVSFFGREIIPRFP